MIHAQHTNKREASRSHAMFRVRFVWFVDQIVLLL